MQVNKLRGTLLQNHLLESPLVFRFHEWLPAQLEIAIQGGRWDIDLCIVDY